MGCCGGQARVHTATVNGRELALPEDDSFSGPLHERVCRDVIFLIIFIAFVIGAIVYLGYVSVEADPARLIHGHDKYGNVCGRKNKKYFNLEKSGQDFTNKPYQSLALEVGDVFVGTWQGLTGTCVASCPAEQTTKVGNRCFPIRTDEAAEKIESITNITFGISAGDFFKTVGQDLGASWIEIVILCSIALAFAVIITALLRFLASIVVWLTVIIMVVGTIGGTIYLWVSWHLKNESLQALKAKSSSTTSELEINAKESSVRSYLIMAIVATIITVLVLILMIAMRSRIRLVIALFKEAGKAVAAMPLILLQPLWTCLWIAVVCMLWFLGWLVIESSGTPQKKDETVVFVKSAFISHMRWYHFFALLWITQFVLACQDVTVAGSIAQWYFTRNRNKLGWPILTAMKRMYRYHLGSLALGSLIIAIVKFIRYIFKHIEKHLNQTNNQFCAFLLKCCQCCLWCFEKFLKFLNRNAYIEIAIYGYGFCKAAQKAFSLLVNNAMRVAAINSVGAFVLFLAKASIVICTGVIGFEMLKNKQGLTYFWVPLLIVVIFAYFIAHCFISIYEMTIDTLFLCFCEDCEKNDGIERPYYMSKGLMKFVENSRKAMEAQEFREKQQVQQVWTTNVHPAGGKAYPVQVASPNHVHGGMTPLDPAYPPNSMPPSPAHILAATAS